jgi:hypothetical protein
VHELIAWLSGRTVAELADILDQRPDVLRRPLRDLPQLAERLGQHVGLIEALDPLPLPAIQLLQSLQLLLPPVPYGEEPAPGASGGLPVADLARLTGRAPDDPELAAVLRLLARKVLAWPDAGRVHVLPPLRFAFGRPHGLGWPVGELIGPLSAAEAGAAAKALGLPARTSKTALVAWFADPDNVRRVVAEAPPAARQLLEGLSRGRRDAYLGGGVAGPVTWTLERCLVMFDPYDQLLLIRETGLALRGPDWKVPFDPAPPVPPTVPVDAAAVRAEAGAVATQLLDRLATLLEGAARTPITRLKLGGVGARELKRLAKEHRSDPVTVRLLIDVAVEAGLLGPVRVGAGPGLAPAAGYDAWATAGPAEQYATLLRAWYTLPAAPPGGETDGAALTRDEAGRLAVPLRAALVRILADLAPGTGLAGPAALPALLGWYAPVLGERFGDDPALYVGALWTELATVGVMAHGALTPWGRAVLDDSVETVGP